jgi:chromosomal replication initiation ATPase DnaA
MRRFPWPAWYEPPVPNYRRSRRLPADDVVREACRLVSISLSEFRSPSKFTPNTDARKASVYVLHRRRPDLSWPQIARLVYRSDHSTAIHAYKAAQRKMAKSPEFAELVMKLEAVG